MRVFPSAMMTLLCDLETVDYAGYEQEYCYKQEQVVLRFISGTREEEDGGQVA